VRQNDSAGQLVSGFSGAWRLTGGAGGFGDKKFIDNVYFRLSDGKISEYSDI
jgi:hypothetical protein